MTDERYNALMDDRNAELDRQEVEQGFHWCTSWDGLLVGPCMMEWLHCECFEDKLKESLAYTGPDMGQEVVFPPF